VSPGATRRPQDTFLAAKIARKIAEFFIVKKTGVDDVFGVEMIV